MNETSIKVGSLVFIRRLDGGSWGTIGKGVVTELATTFAKVYCLEEDRSSHEWSPFKSRRLFLELAPS